MSSASRPDRPFLSAAQVDALAAAVRAGSPVYFAGRQGLCRLARVIGPGSDTFVAEGEPPYADLTDGGRIDLAACRPAAFVLAVPLFPEAR